jgi:hypothetical protein
VGDCDVQQPSAVGSRVAVALCSAVTDLAEITKAYLGITQCGIAAARIIRGANSAIVATLSTVSINASTISSTGRQWMLRRLPLGRGTTYVVVASERAGHIFPGPPSAVKLPVVVEYKHDLYIILQGGKI